MFLKLLCMNFLIKPEADETAEFSYKLTDVNKDAIGQLINDIQARHEMQALNNLWNSLV